jgi:hypothetical protein
MPKLNIRPLTIALVVLDLLLLVVGAIYLVKTATKLPTYFPGHDALVAHDRDATGHHIALALGAFLLGTTALIAAWFTVNPATTDGKEAATLG